MMDPNIKILQLAVKYLGPLAEEMVFIGGATVGLYIDDPAVNAIRPTEDVDCVVEVASLGDYHKLLERLRALGFREDKESGIICRYVQGELILDVMPINAGILSFTNRWYADGMTNRHTRRLPGGEEIQIFSLPYVIASKIEAFKGRGNGDFYGSKDVEDIVTIFDGATSLEEEILSGPIEVRHWISKELASWMKTAEFRSAVEGHISVSRFFVSRTFDAIA